MNTERYSVSLRIQSECRKIQTRITLNTDTFYAMFYVTVTSYKKENLKNKEGYNPVHIAPVQNHYRKLVSSYRFMEGSLNQMNKKGSCPKIFV